MAKKSNLSAQTRNNFWVDVILFAGAVIASLTGIYFLFLPVGGYQGGRNPTYGITILFERHTWEDLHTWFGILMIAAAAVHIVIHWRWIVSMTRRAFQELTSSRSRFNTRSRFNFWLNFTVGLSFLLTALTGIYLLFFPGGQHGVADPNFLFNRTTWDLIHTWAGIAMISAAVIHFAIHWRWVLKVMKKMARTTRPAVPRTLAANQVES